MKITMERLRSIIAEEYARANRQQTQRHPRYLAEGTAENPIQITPEYLNRIIREEYEAFQYKQQLAEARRVRARQRRLAEARRRRAARNYY